uniref:Uncharacterized protein n=1 Tax=Anguilla anguilla TaxID=7936 RepID=A0A0E9RCH8_ANGAN
MYVYIHILAIAGQRISKIL